MKNELERILGREISTDYSIGSHLQRFRYHLDLKGNGHGSWKIMGSGCGVPLIRIDAKPHHRMPSDHLQYGKKDFTGRSGPEAFDIMVEVFRANPDISMPNPFLPKPMPNPFLPRPIRNPYIK